MIFGLLHFKGNPFRPCCNASSAQIAVQPDRNRSTLRREIRRSFWRDPDVPMTDGYWHMNAQPPAFAAAFRMSDTDMGAAQHRRPKTFQDMHARRPAAFVNARAA